MTKINEIFSLQTGTLCRKINNFAGERVKFGLDDGYLAHAHQRDVLASKGLGSSVTLRHHLRVEVFHQLKADVLQITS